MSEMVMNAIQYPTSKELRPSLEPYAKSSWKKPILQLANTLIPFLILWYLMFRSLEISYWLTLGLGLFAAGLNVRIFIFFHDCGHNSFFPSTRVNRIVGSMLGFFVMTPGEQWWKSHAIHHATNGNLDKRGVGDVPTWTVEEYQTSSRWRKILYRIIRNPIMLLVFGPVYIFIISHRIPDRHYGKKEQMSVLYLDLALVTGITLLSLLIGFKTFILIQFPIIWLSGMAGIWLFYIQHQFENAYWERSSRWNYVEAALSGASYYKMPRPFEWITGNIGYHHIHHLNPRIPNYSLDSCYRENEVFQRFVPLIPLGKGYRSLNLALWDEKNHRMVSFSQAAHQLKGR